MEPLRAPPLNSDLSSREIQARARAKADQGYLRVVHLETRRRQVNSRIIRRREPTKKVAESVRASLSVRLSPLKKAGAFKTGLPRRIIDYSGVRPARAGGTADSAREGRRNSRQEKPSRYIRQVASLSRGSPRTAPRRSFVRDAAPA